MKFFNVEKKTAALEHQMSLCLEDVTRRLARGDVSNAVASSSSACAATVRDADISAQPEAALSHGELKRVARVFF